MSMSPIGQGNVYQSQATFTDADGNLVDPDEVYFIYQVANFPSTQVTLQYGDATEPAVGIIANVSEGVYIAQVDMTDISQDLVREWVATGSGQAASTPPFQIAVTALPFPVPS